MTDGIDNRLNRILKLSLDSINGGHIIIDLNKKILYFNHYAEEITGWNSGDAYMQELNTVFMLLNKSTGKAEEFYFDKALKSKTSIELQKNVVLVTKYGEEKYISADFSQIRDNEGNLQGVAINFRDIHEVMQLENQMISERNNMQAIFDYAPIGMVLVDRDLKVRHANQYFLKILNYELNEVLGREFGNGIRCIFSLEHGCGRDLENCSRCKVRTTLESMFETTQSFLEMDVQLHLANHGEAKKLWYRVSFVPIMIDNEKQVMVVMNDITDTKRNIKELIRSKESGQKMLEDLQTMLWIADVNKDCIYLNKAWVSFTGMTRSESLGDKWLNALHPDDVQKTTHLLKQAFDARAIYNTEFKLRRYDGEYRTVISIGSPYYDLDDQFAGYIGTVYDITDQRIAEEIRNHYQVLSKNMHDIILFMDHECRILEANAAAVEIYGYSYEELLSMTVYDLRRVEKGIDKDLIDQAFERGIFIDRIHYSKSGQPLHVEVSSQRADFRGQKALVSIIRDVTGRKETETALIESEAEYKGLFENLRDAFTVFKILLDSDGLPYDLEYTRMNKAFETTFHVQADYAIGRTLSQVFPNRAKLFIDLVRNNYKNGRLVKDLSLEDYHSEAADLWMDISFYTPMPGIVALILRDVTDSKMSKLELIKSKELAEEANKAKSEFLANMSHEIRTPINGIVGMIDITMRTGLNHEQRNNLYIAKNCAGSLLKIINDVLDFSKMEAGKLSIDNLNFDIKALIDEIVRTYTSQIEEKGLELNYTFSSNVPQYLIGDPNRLRQILNNLIGNAVKFTEAGMINVSVKRTKDLVTEAEIRFTVSDTGIGIAKNEQETLFQSFSQIDGSVTRRFGGTGLGLAISKQLVEMMNGEIGVESEKGKGSTFYFSIPFERGSKLEQKAQTEPAEADIVENKSVLLVEDDQVNQLVVSRMLRQRGFEVDIVNNGAKALKRCKEKTYDLILMDIHMPVMDGIEATQQIRESEGDQKHTPIIALTAHALKGDRERFLSVGMDDYISKPIQMDALFAAIENELHKKNQLHGIHGFQIGEDGEVSFVYAKDQESRSIDGDFLSGVEIRIAELKGDLNKGNLDAAEMLAHKLKQLCSEIGAEDLKNTAFQIELSLRRKDLQNIKKNTDLFEQEYLTLKNWYQDER